MRKVGAISLAMLLALSGVVAHTFNHEDRHEQCQVYDEELGIHPNDHHANDGHEHVHHAGAAETAHYHGDTLYEAGHSHDLHKHDPCNQAGMATPAYQDNGDLQKLTIEDAIIGKPSASTINVILEGEAFKLPLLAEQRNLIIMGDNSLAAQGFPGSGTPEDPYIIEGYHIRNVMQLKDTHDCVVIRNNVVYDDIIEGPIVDPDDIIDRRVLDSAFQEARAALEAQISSLANQIEETESALGDVPVQQASIQSTSAQEELNLQSLQQELKSLQAQLATLNAQKAQRDQERAASDAHADRLDEAQAANDNLIASLSAMFDVFTEQFDAFVQEYEAFEATYEAPSPPPDNLEALQGDELVNELGIYTVQFVKHAEKAAPTPPESDANQKRYQQYQDEYDGLLSEMQNYIDAIDAAKSERVNIQNAITAHGASQDARAQEDQELQDEIDAAQGRIQDQNLAIGDKVKEIQSLAMQLEALTLQHAALLQQLQGLNSQHALQSQSLSSVVQEHQALLLQMADGIYEYAGSSYDSLKELSLDVLATLEEQVENELAGRMIFDWNGQCIHAYHNVVQDLRVNRNNDRRGFATGGVIEENRFFTVGQIRHYDGEFRENEVGDRAILEELVAGGSPAGERAINNDGANQGNFHHNLIYGGIDLDFHGHHHGAGFFATEGHYHGSDDRVKYMFDSNGQPMTFDEGNNAGKQVPHHNHDLRWTSVGFHDNVIIDPNGNGLRYEDQNHEGDDRFANSENMRELDNPHIHRSLIEIERNTVVGILRMDVINANGVDVWSDDLTEVERDTTTQEVVNALLHLGADIINTHQERNDAWVDVSNNDIYLVGGGTGVFLNHVKEAEVSIDNNRIFVLPGDLSSFTDADAFLAFLADGADKSADEQAAVIANHGTGGPATGILLAHVKDSSIEVCANELRGPTVGLKATNHIYEDVFLKTCSNNSWGNADPRVDVRFMPYPKAEELLTQPIRDVTDESMAEHVLDPVYDDVDDVGNLL